MGIVVEHRGVYATHGGLAWGLGLSSLVAAMVLLPLSIPPIALVLLPVTAAVAVAWAVMSLAAVGVGVACLCFARDGSGKYALMGICWALLSWVLTVGITFRFFFVFVAMIEE
ncbi:MAG: hypothetical protein FJ290_14195 [Planctomycetes bacterium]|nr:hypothetical protein [Planctomycetota bacterium]